MALPPRFTTPPFSSISNEFQNNASWHQRNETHHNVLNKPFQHHGGNSHFSGPPNNFSIPPPSVETSISRPTLHPLNHINSGQPAAHLNMNRLPPGLNAHRPPIPLDMNRPPPPMPIPNPSQFIFPNFQEQGFPPSNSHHVSFRPPQPPFAASQIPPNMTSSHFNVNNQIHSYSNKQQNTLFPGDRSHPNVLHQDDLIPSNQRPQAEIFETEIEGKRKKGEQLLASWLQKTGKAKRKVDGDDIKNYSNSSVKINDYLCKLQNIRGSIADMSCQLEKLEGMMSDADKLSWKKEQDTMEALKTQHQNLQNLMLKTNIEQVERKLATIRQRKSRLKRSHHLKHQQKQEVDEMRQNKEREISEWQQRLLSEMKEELLKKKRKEDMDQTLSDVTKKINDANRLIDTMTALEKLRLIRQDAAKKRGDSDIGESRQSFEQKIADMTRLVQSQLEVYKEEEQRLRKMIKSEHEESSKKERQQQEKKDQEEQEQKDEDLRKTLFGFLDDASISDPLFPYQQFYKQVEISLPAFVQIRREWDQYIVPSDNSEGSTIPSGWLHPCDPSSSAWASALK